MSASPSHRTLSVLLSLVLAAGGVWLWSVYGQGKGDEVGNAPGAVVLGERIVATKSAPEGSWQLMFPDSRPTVAPMPVMPGGVREMLRRLYPEAAASGALPKHVTLHAVGEVPMGDVLFLLRDLAGWTTSELQVVLQVDAGSASPVMTYLHGPSTPTRPTLRAAPLENETSGAYVLLSAGDRSVRILRTLFTERASNAIAAQVPESMLADDLTVRLGIGSGAPFTLTDGATLYAALRRPGRTLRIAD